MACKLGSTDYLIMFRGLAPHSLGQDSSQPNAKLEVQSNNESHRNNSFAECRMTTSILTGERRYANTSTVENTTRRRDED